MGRLLIVRHAHAGMSREHEDFDRPLSGRGISTARKLGVRLASESLMPDFCLCSSSLRTRQTVEQMMEGIEQDLPVQFQDELYLASCEEILFCLRSCGLGQSPMICGHNPGISEFASRLSGGGLASLPPGGMVMIELPGFPDPGTRWEQLEFDEGRVSRILLPE